jgi:hypothetical protein
MPWDLEKQIISAGYKQLSKRAHPDKGGTSEQMVKLNAARDRLKALIAGAESSPLDNPQAARAQAQPGAKPVTLIDLNEFLRQTCAADPFASSLFNAFEEFTRSYSKAKRARPRRH